MTLTQYIQDVNSKYISGIAREHAYRADLENLIKNIVPRIDVTNEPANVTDCGNPDYVLTEDNIPRGFIEAKDVGKDLNDKTLNSKGYRELLELFYSFVPAQVPEKPLPLQVPDAVPSVLMVPIQSELYPSIVTPVHYVL